MNGNLITELISALGTAWDNLFDIARPRFLRVQSYGSDELVPAAFPLLGTVIGLLAALFFWIISWITIGYAAAFICALISWFVLSFKDSGSGDRKLVLMLVNRFTAGAEISENIFYGIILALRFVILLLGAMHGDMAALAIVLGGGFAMQGALAISRRCDMEIFPRSGEVTRNFCISAVICALCCALTAPLTILPAVMLWLLLYIIFTRPDDQIVMDADLISTYGTISENSLLMITLLF